MLGPVVDKLEVEVTDPVDYVEKQERGGEKDPGVGIQLPNVDVDPTFPPAALFALLVAAEEARAVLPVQALVQAVVLVVVPEQGVAHGHHGPRAVHHAEGGVRLPRESKRVRRSQCVPFYLGDLGVSSFYISRHSVLFWFYNNFNTNAI